MRLVTTFLLLIASAGLGSFSVQAFAQSYVVKDGNRLDAATYKGYKLYRNWCARCHGTFGQGLAGPDLTQRLNSISFDEFMQTVAEGKSGQIGMMPAWKTNPAVMQGRADIYSYLKARADGAIGAVKPEKF
jgi:mono/diheme cytochrome c family protein